ncbi:MAG TPA: hypothetical protein VIZ17_16215 [Acetobacteraceae bacterium]
MSGPLYIQQGSPHWWLSPAIWVTPVGDPATKIANPIAGQDYTVWVQVQNRYPDPVDNSWNLFVCWTIPTAGSITVASITSNQILNGVISPIAGTVGLPITTPIPGASGATPSIVNLQAAKTWTPSYEHNGHECLIALAYFEQSIGGLPVSTLKGDAPWQQTYTIAQHNLGVLPATHHMKLFQYPFQVCNAEHEERGFVIAATQAPLSQIAEFLPGVPGGRKVLDRPGKVEHLGIIADAHPDRAESRASSAAHSSIKIAPHSCRAFTLTGSLPEGNALIHVTQSLDERVVGGLSVLVLAEAK